MNLGRVFMVESAFMIADQTADSPVVRCTLDGSNRTITPQRARAAL
jgi:hypothetical protein